MFGTESGALMFGPGICGGGGLCGNRIGRLQIRSFLFLCCFVGKAKSSTKKSGAKMKIINEAKHRKPSKRQRRGRDGKNMKGQRVYRISGRCC